MPWFDASSQNHPERYFWSVEKQSQALNGASRLVFVLVPEELVPKELHSREICVREKSVPNFQCDSHLAQKG